MKEGLTMSYRAIRLNENFYIVNKWYLQDIKYSALLSFLIDSKCHG